MSVADTNVAETQVKRRRCALCGALEETIIPQPSLIQHPLLLKEFRLGYGCAYDNGEFVGNRTADNNRTRFGVQCRCYNLIRFGDIRGEEYAEEANQVRFLVVKIVGGELTGVSYYNWKAMPIARMAIPVTLAALRIVRPESVNDILTHPAGLSQLLRLGVSPKVQFEAIKLRDSDRIERMVENNLAGIRDYLQQPELNSSLLKIKTEDGFRELVNEYGIATWQTRVPEPATV